MKIKIIVLIFLLFLGFNSAKAQLSKTRAEIIKEKGYNYTSGVTNTGTKFISYDEEITTKSSGKYTQTKVIYFTTLDNGSEICYSWKLLEPASETNSNVAYFKNRYVETIYMQWKDYENNVIYDIVVKNGLCITTVMYDNEK